MKQSKLIKSHINELKAEIREMEISLNHVKGSEVDKINKAIEHMILALEALTR